MAEMSPPRHRMTDDTTVRNLSPATQRSYIYAVRKFSRAFEADVKLGDLAFAQSDDLYVGEAQMLEQAIQSTNTALRTRATEPPALHRLSHARPVADDPTEPAPWSLLS